ncbi:MAG: hypothetical protein FWG43_05695 [Clostridiales bacterium]|nr:hypothetical protein [Clostridiales bacterium]
MFILGGLVITIAFLITAALNNFYLGFPLLGGYIYFTILSLFKGHSLVSIAAMSWQGAKKAFIVIPIILSIGCLTSMWMAAGTVAAFVYYGLAMISPSMFIFIAFISTSAVSVLLGSCYGSAGTIGVILMAMAKSGHVNPYVAGGAIIAAAFVGDRCSPMASVLHLLSAVTETEPYRNIKMALKTSVGPFLISAALYMLLSYANPLTAVDTTLHRDIAKLFNIGFIPFLPAIIVMALCLFKVNVKLAMLISATAAALIAFFIQGASLPVILNSLIYGFEPAPGSSLSGVIHGGGMWSMLKTSMILLISCALSGILLGIDATRGLDKILAKPCGRTKLYLKTGLVGLAGICCGCNQVIPILLCNQVLHKPYELSGLSRYDLARDISYTVLPLSAAVPWCLASMVPTATLGLPLARHLPYLFYPLLLPLWYGAYYALSSASKKEGSLTNK